MRILASIAAVLVLASCSAVNRDLSRLRPSGSGVDAVIAASFERTWLAATMALEGENLAMETADDALGTIRTEFVTAGVNLDEQACLGLSTRDNEWVEAIRYRVRLQLTRESQNTTRVRAYADVQGQVSSQNRNGTRYREGAWHDCTSTGKIERRILDAVQERLADQE